MVPDITDQPRDHDQLPLEFVVSGVVVFLWIITTGILTYTPLESFSGSVSAIFSVANSILGILVSLFVIGYLFILLVGIEPPTLSEESGFTLGDRVILSFVVSISILVFQFLIMTYQLPEFDVSYVSTSTGALSILLFVANLIYRYADMTPPPVDYFRECFAKIRSDTQKESVLDALIVLLLLTSIIVVTLPSIGDQPATYTEFGLLTTGEDGELSAPDAPLALDLNGASVTISISNRERQRVNYTIVAQGQKAVIQEKSVEVLNRQTYNTHQVTIKHNNSKTITYNLSGSPETASCRVVFLLYRDDVPKTPTIENAYRELHIWNGEPPTNPNEGCQSLSEMSVTQI